MPYPTELDISYSYTDFAVNLGDGSFPGTQIDNDFADVELSVDEINAWLRMIFTSEGVLRGQYLPDTAEFTVGTDYSLTGGGALGDGVTLSLVNDTDPSAFQFYGTNVSATRGWYNLPGISPSTGGAPAVAGRTALAALVTASPMAFLVEGGRSGAFRFDASNLATKVATDPMQGVYVALASDPTGASGAWVRAFSGAVNVLWFGADNTGTVQAQNQIQAAIEYVFALGGGLVFVPVGTYLIGLTTLTIPTTFMPVEKQYNYGLFVRSGVVLVGEGRASHLKRAVADPLVVVIAKDGYGTQIRNIRIDGNNTNFPITGDTYGSGAGIGIESTTVTDDRETVVDTVFIDDTPGYGIGVEWGDHRGCTLRNIFIDGTGSDGIDIKRMNSGSFLVYSITVDNIHITNFGRSATDAATQAGLDLRGFVTVSNVHVNGVWGAQASAGIRMQATGDTVIGANYVSVSNFFVDRDSGGQATTYGILNNGAEQASFENGSVRGCTINVSAVGNYAVFDTVRSNQATSYGFYTGPSAIAARFLGCSDNLSPTSFRLAGDRGVLDTPLTVNNAVGGWHIYLESTANNVSIAQHILTGTNAQVFSDNSATPAFYQAGRKTNIGNKTSFEVGDVAAGAGDSWPMAASGSGAAVVAATSTAADADIQLNTKGAGFHAFGGTKTATTVGAAGGATALPATPTGYMRVKIAGTIRKLPYYAD